METAQTRILKNGLKPVHELLAEYILQRPQATLHEMSAFFEYSPSWLCQVINSDMFKAYMAGRMKEVQAVVTQDVPARMAALAHLAMDRMEETLNKTGDPELIVDSFDKVMHRYGYAPNARNAVNQGGVIQQQNVFYLNQDQFRKVQEKLVNAHSNPAPAPALEHNPQGDDEGSELSPVSEKVPASG